METITLTIPNMKSPHCMMVVSSTLKDMTGVSLKKVTPGEAQIELSGATKVSVLDAIEKAGYTVANK
ncbi:MAG: heavy-metal-associated domain-containing protein [Cyclobacteriaceae bacterium]|nr:heavy-metal-associated domain-containing protein [Cyclobacteriaceae bacterium]